MNSQKVVTPAKAGVQMVYKSLKRLDSGFRRNDGKRYFMTFCETIKIKPPLYLFFFDIQPIISYSGSFPIKTAINPEPLMPWIQTSFDTLLRCKHRSVHDNSEQ